MKISIITPVYNRSDCIIRCMESVTRAYEKWKENLFSTAPTHLFLEQIIVDDGSTDGTQTLVKKYAEEHSHVHFIEFSHNKGTNAARNAAIQSANGEWCIILDSDDYFTENALGVITRTIESHPPYIHYMFAADDMLSYYEHNPIIEGVPEKILLYPDFLNGHIGGDFVHVCRTETLRLYPFDENIRIYEGIFFLLFYKKAQQMLFTNEVVTIRERNRNDSVTRDTFRTNRIAIKRSSISSELYLKYFETEMEQLGMQRRLREIRFDLLDNYVLLGEYGKASTLMHKIGDAHGMKNKFLHVIHHFRLGWLYRFLLKIYLFLKYQVLKKNLETK